ncbi:hypothetical protein K1F50_15215 [Muricauda oceani]|uniref:DUF7793 domain-containing protein n=1 Tax=Flagellimonas oceani TaxID=2698672 RepID=A0A6G7J3T9_9FLAO|nr:hypothetical protein [Allomuricauda oceani]MBW8244157.1 hypothetical protein [Allomuricauda oceani]QII45127.1 hypothetical protein GVT53_10685 [Allomuricauda oceani]
MKRIVETELATMWLENDILFFVWKEGISIDLSGAKKTVARRMLLQQGKPYRILCNINGVRHIEKDAWHFLSGDGAGLVEELVLVAATPLERAFSKYISNRMRSAPIKVFPHMETARKYLSRHR